MAEHYVHSGMVGLDGVKMSKSLGNLKLVSNLVASGESPMAIRTLLLDHHYRSDWSYTDEALAAGSKRLETWKSAMAFEQHGDADTLASTIFAALSDDLDAPVAQASMACRATGASRSPESAAKIVEASVSASPCRSKARAEFHGLRRWNAA